MARAAHRRWLLVGAIFALVAVTLALLRLLADPRPSRGSEGSIPIGVLGDSDSHSYHDRISFGSEGPQRGGRFRAHTFQWPEALARLRPAEVTMGEWGVWGTRGAVARLRAQLGLSFRSFRKEDYQFNLAGSGARCVSVAARPLGQVWSLVSLMDQDPQYWKGGLVVIRIGVNDFGQAESLDLLATNPQSPPVQASIAECVGMIATAVDAIRARHADTAIVLVGIFDNTNWPRYFDRWRTAQDIINIRRGLDQFDSGLRDLASKNSRVAFFDDRSWFESIWGARQPDGTSTYRAVRIGTSLSVNHSEGDSPDHSIVADGHAGLVWNALWAQALIRLANAEFLLEVPPIDDAEAGRWIDAQIAATPR